MKGLRFPQSIKRCRALNPLRFKPQWCKVSLPHSWGAHLHSNGCMGAHPAAVGLQKGNATQLGAKPGKNWRGLHSWGRP